MAAAMLGGVTFSANADLTLKDVLDLQSQGKAVPQVMKTLKDNKLPNVKTPYSSRFQKLVLAKDKDKQMSKVRKAPAKVTKQGDSIYGYLGYSASGQDMGLYEFDDNAQSLVWVDDQVYETSLYPSAQGYFDGKLIGYGQMTFWGYILAVYYMEYDFATGEVMSVQQQDLDESTDYISQMAVDTDTETIYGYGVYDGELAFMKAPVSDPLNYTLICPADDMCFSMSYNSDDKSLIGVQVSSKDLVYIDMETGATTPIMNLTSTGAYQYISGMVYDPVSKIYYWQFIRSDESAAMATINVAEKTIDIYEEFPETVEYYGLFTTDTQLVEGQPGLAAPGEADFYKNNLIGFVTFTLPTQYSDGSELPENVDYKAYLNGDLYTVGSGKAGQEVKINYVVPGNGSYVFELCASVDGVDGKKVKVRAYVGNDTPVAPANVTLTDSTVTWDPVTAGIHGGYVDAKAVRYNVYLNGVPVAAETGDTYCEISINKEDELSAYSASVQAVCNGLAGDFASSNTIVEGSPLTLPLAIEPDPEQYGLCTVLDANEDGSTWSLTQDYYTGNYFVKYSYNSYNSGDDYFFLPPFVVEDADKYYSFSMEAALYSDYYVGEYVEALLCNAPSADGVISEVVKEFSPESSEFELATGEFKVPAPGTYYIAIHATSDPDQYALCARNFTVEDNGITDASPVAVKDLDVEAGEKGALTATVTFTMPDKTMGGEEIPADTELTATVSAAENEVVTGKPGDEISVEVKTIQGQNVVSVVVAIDDNNSPAAMETVYTGVSVPATISSLEYSLSADFCTMTLTWPAVTDSDDGGYLDPETVVYDIYKYEVDEDVWVLYEPDITDTSYDYTADEQDLVELGVVSRNEAGDNGYLLACADVVGPSLALPIIEDFEDRDFNYNPWLTYESDSADFPSMKIQSTSVLGGDYADSNSGCLVVKSSGEALGQLGSPYFTTVGVESAYVNLDVCGDFELPEVLVLAEGNGVDAEVIGTVNVTEPGFHKVSVEIPAKYLGNDRVTVLLQFEFTNSSQVFATECINIEKTSGVAALGKADVKAEYFSIDGLKVRNPQGGIFIRRQGNTSEKVIIK